ncbi:hypothetical protein NESM_000146400 [Novymonas esmeraldas]|uniref:Uncharacterized protein n=1 Tax=Novymonas esmeraldas TaxID=1808958 RepID=A0AAW0F6W8_9TRYP
MLATATRGDGVSAAESYALWGERIRELFSGPASRLDTDLDPSHFERRSCCVPQSPSWEGTRGPVHRAHSDDESWPPQPSPADANAGTHAPTGRSFHDEALFPACFYARMLRSQAATNRGRRGDADRPREDSHSTPMVPQQQQQQQHHPDQRAFLDDDAVADRLTGRLRGRAAQEQARLRRLRVTAAGNLVAPFCDPAVERQQARLHSELTQFLLEVRRENAASVVLRHQLQYSRSVRELLHDNVDSLSASVPPAMEDAFGWEERDLEKVHLP